MGTRSWAPCVCMGLLAVSKADFSPAEKLHMRETVRQMFYHSYSGCRGMHAPPCTRARTHSALHRNRCMIPRLGRHTSEPRWHPARHCTESSPPQELREDARGASVSRHAARRHVGTCNSPSRMTKCDRSRARTPTRSSSSATPSTPQEPGAMRHELNPRPLRPKPTPPLERDGYHVARAAVTWVSRSR